jgi:hypothetical protein
MLRALESHRADGRLDTKQRLKVEKQRLEQRTTRLESLDDQRRVQRLEAERTQRLGDERRADEQRRLEEERRQAKAKVGSLYDGARYLITNTRRVAYSSKLFNKRKRSSNCLNDILSLYAEADMLSIRSPVSGRVPALQDNIEAVGAVLFDGNGEYSGVAVPVVKGESHTTMIPSGA